MRAAVHRLPDVDLHTFEDGAGEVVMLAHGFPDEPMTFAGTARALVAKGFRVVLPTMRGYAPSSEAKSQSYDVVHLGDDLVELADVVSKDAPVHLVGHDWGAIAAFSAVAAAPHRFRTLTTVSVPHLVAMSAHLRNAEQLARSWYIGMFQVPWYAERRLAADDFALIERLFRDWSPGYAASAEELDAVKAAIRPRVGAVLAYYRALKSPEALFGEARRRTWKKVSIPAVHVHGADDGCIGIACCEGAESHYEGPYRLVRVEGAGHFVTREAPDALTEAILDVMRLAP